MEMIIAMGIQASLLIVIVLIIRLFTRRLPKIYIHMLWLLVVARLILPVFIESSIGVLPQPAVEAVINQADDVGNGENTSSGKVYSGEKENSISGVTGDNAVSAGNTAYTGNTEDIHTDYDITADIAENSEISPAGKSAQPLIRNLFNSRLFQQIILSVYLCGAFGIQVYVVTKYIHMHRKMRFATRYKDNVWQSDKVAAPFVMGFFKAKIYIPYGLEGNELEAILSHERMHIKHCDHIVRLLMMVAICLHWWNPLVWVAMNLMKRDMEMFCDESVLRDADIETRRNYTNALLNYACRQNGIIPVLSFGESNVERRIKNIFRFRRPGIIVSCVLLAAVAAAAVVFFTTAGDEKSGNTDDIIANNETSQDETTEEPATEQELETDIWSSMMGDDGVDWSIVRYEGYMDELESHCESRPEGVLSGKGSVSGFTGNDFDGDRLIDRIYREYEENEGMHYYLHMGNGEKYDLGIFYAGEYNCVLSTVDLTGDGTDEIALYSSGWSSGDGIYNTGIFKWEDGQYRRMHLNIDERGHDFNLEFVQDNDRYTLNVYCPDTDTNIIYRNLTENELEYCYFITEEDEKSKNARYTPFSTVIVEYDGMPAVKYTYNLGVKSSEYVQEIVTYTDGVEKTVRMDMEMIDLYTYYQSDGKYSLDSVRYSEFEYMGNYKVLHGEDASILVGTVGDDTYSWAVIMVCPDASAVRIWSDEIDTSHSSRAAYFACSINGEDYILRYNPYAQQGMADYDYKLFKINESGEEVVADENNIVFDSQNTMGGQHTSSKEEITEFINTVNFYLENSRLLVSTLEGVTETGDGQICNYRENLDVMNFDMESAGLDPDNYTVEEKIELMY